MENGIILSVKATLDGQGSLLSKLLNSLALVKQNLGEDSWVGLYVYDEKDNVLNLGPFQGSPACVQIKPGKGVVGKCYASKMPMYINDVKKFPGYICCDSKVKSEAVFPLVYNGHVIAVFSEKGWPYKRS
jgi:GAF domain-containing protein